MNVSKYQAFLNSHILVTSAINFAVILLALIEAWLARKLSTEFQETAAIFGVAVTIVTVLAIGIPVVILARGSPDACVFISSAIIFLICIDILWSLFVPKMRYKEKAMTTTISGLNLSVLKQSTTEPALPSFPNAATTSDNGDISDDDTASLDEGERILATKDRNELAEEVVLLKKLLRAKNRREGAFRSCRSHHNDDTGGAGSDTDTLEKGLKDPDDAEDELDITDTTRAMHNLSRPNCEESARMLDS